MVSEIPRVRQNEVKNILETGINVPKWGTIKPRRGDARLVWGDISPDWRKYGVGIAVGVDRLGERLVWLRTGILVARTDRMRHSVGCRPWGTERCRRRGGNAYASFLLLSRGA